MTIYVSTGGYKNSKAEEISKSLLQDGIDSIELSGTIYHPEIISNLCLLKKKINFQIHNYFPPPKKAFVLNLASEDSVISKMTIEHIEKAIECCQKLNSKYYSFHAGFLCDIKINELGKKVEKKILQDREKSIDLFLERVLKISNKAKEAGIKIMIENNVLSKNNQVEFQGNPLLMCDSKECIKIINNTPDNVKLLLDVAHLKVSSNSLNFDPIEFLKECNNIIGGYHFSDNNGTSDSNDPFSEDSWFWNYIKPNLDYYSIEVYNQTNEKIKLLKDMVKNKLKSLDK